MKATIFLLALMVSVGYSQEIATKTMALRGVSAGTLFSGKAYIDSQSDTSQALNVRQFRDAYVRFTVLDSVGSTVIWYRANVTGTTFQAKTTIGTVSASTANGGFTESFALPATALSGKNFQLGVTFAGSGNGVSSATYTLDVLAK